MIFAFLGLCALLMIEKLTLRKSRASLGTVIHVNGIRGKTTTCRMLDAVLRERYTVLTKTTGTDARILHVGGQDLPVKRIGAANIREQARALRMAAREKAQVAVLECMAVAPELQRVSEEQIVHADIAVITNVRYDHIYEMGGSLESIASSLAGMIPRGGVVYTGDAAFFPFFEEQAARKGSRAVLCVPEEGKNPNEAVVRSIAGDLGMTAAEIDAGLLHVQADPGMEALFMVPGTQGAFPFLNLFAANDPQSAMERLLPLQGQYERLRFVYNHRLDRPDRLELFAQRFFPQLGAAQVILMGDAYPLARRLLKKHAPALKVSREEKWQALLDTPPDTLLVGLGNTRGEAKRMLAAIEEEGDRVA